MPAPGEKPAQGFPHNLPAMWQVDGAAQEGAGRVPVGVLAHRQGCGLLASSAMSPWTLRSLPVGSLLGVPSHPIAYGTGQRIPNTQVLTGWNSCGTWQLAVAMGRSQPAPPEGSLLWGNRAAINGLVMGEPREGNNMQTILALHQAATAHPQLPPNAACPCSWPRSYCHVWF